MQIDINNPALQTMIFGGLLMAAIIVGLRKKNTEGVLPISTTNELRGLAILAIFLAHIGYFLARNTQFLQPLSNYAGVGVDLFLFLSGFGLTVSMIKKKITIRQFYTKRLLKIFIPMWLLLLIFLPLDYFILHRTYPALTIFKSFVGIFQQADLFTDFNSPLWYITWTLFFYLLFPLIFIRKSPTLSAVLLFFTANFLVNLKLPVSVGVLNLYSLHTVALPLGIIAADIIYDLSWFKKIPGLQNMMKNKKLLFIASLLLTIAGLGLAYYLGNHSAVGKSKNEEQFYSIVIMAILIFTWQIKPFTIQTLEWLGHFSYEFYLLHWIILYRYDLLYKYLPAGIATMIYIIVLTALGFVFHKLDKKINHKLV